MAFLETRPFRFIHCGDLHLDSPFTGLGHTDSDIKKILYDASFQAFEKVLDYGLEEKASFVLIAGDIYDSLTRSLRAQLNFRDLVRKAGKEGLSIYVVHGNHDPLDSWTARVSFPDNLFRFPDRLSSVTHYEDGSPLAEIWGISYARKETSENLARRFSGIPRERDIFRIGLLHCNVGGVSTLHQNYAPCSLGDLIDGPVDYWALGHVHEMNILHDSSPMVVYPGNIQGRHMKEQGEKGCFLVSVDSGRVDGMEFLPTSEVLWMEEQISLSGNEEIADIHDLVGAACDRIRSLARGRLSIARLSLTGTSDLQSFLNNPLFLDQLVQTFRDRERNRLDLVWIESIRNRTRGPSDLSELKDSDSFLSDFLRVAHQARHDPGLVETFLRETPGFNHIRLFLEKGDFPDYRELVDDAEKLGLSRLLEEHQE